MNRLQRLGAAAAALVASLGAPAGAVIYHGFPHLHLMTAVVDAGGGASHFDAHRLMNTLAGSRAASENAKLVKEYGTARVASYYRVFSYAVGDATKRAHNMLIPLPKSAQPDPADGRAVAAALYGAGVTPRGQFDVGYMLEALMSHQIHHTIMGDMDRTFTPPANADFHVILTTAMRDLHAQYGVARL